MNNKFDNYLYDYMVREGFIEDKNPKDQKEKMLYVNDYFEKINKFYNRDIFFDDELFKKICDRYVINFKDIPDSYFRHHELIDFNRGFGYEVLSEEDRHNHADMIIKDQIKSLENILKYFSSDELGNYSDKIRFWAFHGVLKLGKYNRETKNFSRRTKGTIFPFIGLNKQALKLTMDTMIRILNNEIDISDEIVQSIFNSTGGLNNSFVKLYTYYFNYINDNRDNSLVDGVWIKFDQDSDYNILVNTLVGKGTGWCIVIDSTARRQLKKGNFYIYYTKDQDGECNVPRIAIRTNSFNNIIEVSGIDKNQEVELVLREILNKKLDEFSNKNNYLKKEHDMKKMTIIYNKVKNNIDLSVEELRFLYEIDDEIKGFGYSKDPRINEIIDGRNIKKDLVKVFNCSCAQIGVEPDLLTDVRYKYYYGDLNLDCYYGDNIVLPEVVSGNLYLDNLLRIGQMVFPDVIKKNLYMRNMYAISNFKFSSDIGGNIYLNNLIKLDNVIFSRKLNGSLRMENLQMISNLTFPEYMKGSLHLDSVRYADNIAFPKIICGSLILTRLCSIKNSLFPMVVDGTVYLESLDLVDNLIVPNDYSYGKIEISNLDKIKVLSKKK